MLQDVMDLAWSSDGLHLVGVSADGTLVHIAFDSAELGAAADAAERRTHMSRRSLACAAHSRAPLHREPRVRMGILSQCSHG